MTCQDCVFSELLPDGSLYCVLLDAITHAPCDLWQNDPHLFGPYDERNEFGEEEHQRIL